MFLDNLCNRISCIYDERRLTYETAAELCDLSPRHIGNILCRKTKQLSIPTFEKLCKGFEMSPNDLLLPQEIQAAISRLQPMPVTHIRCYRYSYGDTGYPVCPNCKATMEREFQRYCDRCGQHLEWRLFSHAIIIPPEK